MEVREQVEEIFKNLFFLDSVAINLSQDDVEGWDSMQHLNLVMALEEEFDLSISPEESTEMLTFELVCLLIEEKLKTQ